MRILITGANGQLGYWLKKVFEEEEILATDRDEMDITDQGAVLRVARDFQPEVIVHGAAYTAVDQAESDKEGAYLVNEVGTENIVEAAKQAGAKVVYVSTDYVFDGMGAEPYLENDKPSPQSVYGESKLAGEKAIQSLDNFVIARTAWLYGEKGKNFVETMLKLADAQPQIRVVNDQIGSPTYAKDLAQAIKFLVEKEARGIFHTVNAGQCSWYDFASKIFELTGKKVKVSPVSTDEFPRPAKRPAHSVLSTDKLTDLGYKMRSWEEALKEYLINRGMQ